MRRQNTGLLALALVGGYFLYRNRSQIQGFLQDQGVDLKNINFRDFRNWIPNRRQVREIAENVADQSSGVLSRQQRVG